MHYSTAQLAGYKGSLSKAINYSDDGATCSIDLATAEALRLIVDQAAEAATLKAEVANLEARLKLRSAAEVEQVLGFDVMNARETYGLEPAEAKLFVMLARASDWVLRSEVYRTLVGERQADPKIVEVQICKLRKKIKSHGLIIENKTRVGYRLNHAGVAA